MESENKSEHFTVIVSRISEDGDVVKLSKDEKWLTQMIQVLMPEYPPDPDSIHGQVEIHNYDGSVDIRGVLDLTYHPLCDRCATSLDRTTSIPIAITLAPLEKAEPHLRVEGESDFNEDLGFAFYSHDKFELDMILNDVIGLAIPIQFHCKDDCRGLCPDCGQDLNKGSCDCAKKRINPKWEKLTTFQAKNR